MCKEFGMERRRLQALIAACAFVLAGCGDDSGSSEQGDKAIGAQCEKSAECASGNCKDGACAEAETPEPTPDGNRANGASCSADAQCASGHCAQGKCAAKDGEKGGIGDACKANGDCASSRCDNGRCVAADATPGDIGDDCKTNSGCASGLCHAGKCAASICGNGELEDGEACDDGNTKDGDGCSADCKTVEEGYHCDAPGYDCIIESCGNGYVENGEECDDGMFNVDYGKDACSPACKKAHYCGDGLLEKADIDNGEECDAGENNRPADSQERDVCSTECKRLNYCGDGKIQDGEACDDRNSADGDGCSSQCQVEAGWTCVYSGGKSACSPLACGNGVVEPEYGEACDDGGRVSGDGCSANCRIESGWNCTQKDETGKSVCVQTCGNGVVESEYGETCDDGNTASGDGCSSACKAEAGYNCVVAKDSQRSTCYARLCGDGYVAGSEECDDGNAKDGDGCSSSCKREPGYHCPAGGGACEKDVCGDGKVTGDETCDEGTNKTAGCIDCKMQAGWECLVPGASCTQTAECGNGKLEGIEECDEGTNKTDGCNGCAIAAGWRCPDGAGKACIKGVCGDGILDKGEACDDGNTQAGDGCSPICETEPIFECMGSECRPTCGDGLTLLEAGEECDDGNNIAGDGCSPDCKIESGWTCEAPGASATWPQYLDLPITYRDFIKYDKKFGTGDGYVSQALYDSVPDSCKGTDNGYRAEYPLEVGRPSPDFYSYCPDSRCLNVVLPDLDDDGKPALNAANNITKAPNMSEQVTCRYLYTCPEVFKWWYTDVAGLNKRYDATLRLTHKGSGTYEYSNTGFLPLKNITDAEGGRGYTDVAGYGEFTSEFHTYFKYNGNEKLTFNGDDDVWVFFNRKLAVDVGGIHPAWEKSITLSEATAKGFKMFPGGIYPFDMFHAERCLGGSSFKLTLTGFVQMGKSTCDTKCGDGIVAGAEECDIEGHVDDEVAQKAGCYKCKFKSYCGNGKVETGEGCDEGGDNDWCKSCKIVTCGNGKLDEHEGCDTVDGKVVFAGKTEAESQGLTCSMCRIVGCGDGIVDEGEECDDGNSIDNDGCTNACKRPTCGDGIVQTFMGEVCDDGINDGAYGHCGLGCAYQAPRCGDGVVDSYQGEICDDGINDGSYGTCNADCTPAPHCGDGIVQEGFETCDEGDNNGKGSCGVNCMKIIN